MGLSRMQKSASCRRNCSRRRSRRYSYIRAELICGMSRVRVKSLQSSSNTRLSNDFAHMSGLPVIGANGLDGALDCIVIDIEVHHQPNRRLLMTKQYLPLFEMQ